MVDTENLNNENLTTTKPMETVVSLNNNNMTKSILNKKNK